MVSNYLNDAGVEYETVDVTQKPEVAAQYEVMAACGVVVSRTKKYKALA
ncbi:hypothetical protein KXY09_10695 [Bacillus velezensis]|nr:hypothetical protein KXY09_10695 [Bacillus velezensis]